MAPSLECAFNGLVVSAVSNAAGNRVLTASLDQTARLWDAETEAAVTGPIAVLKENVGAHMRDTEFSPDGTRLVTAGEVRTPRIWRLFPNMPTLVAEARKVVPRCLTQEQRAEAYLDSAPADWCVAMAKWPYHTEQWTAWLRQKQSGLNPPLPGRRPLGMLNVISRSDSKLFQKILGTKPPSWRMEEGDASNT